MQTNLILGQTYLKKIIFSSGEQQIDNVLSFNTMLFPVYSDFCFLCFTPCSLLSQLIAFYNLDIMLWRKCPRMKKDAV